MVIYASNYFKSIGVTLANKILDKSETELVNLTISYFYHKIDKIQSTTIEVMKIVIIDDLKTSNACGPDCLSTVFLLHKKGDKSQFQKLLTGFSVKFYLQNYLALPIP